ncbi:hypothetical protein M422DRAFT_27483 [Sphaerobolus stellatus SS14]|nr:hypothetical protein M422DRAFT_27483 [Sphaerobolus stellatus SS14]
MTKIYLKGYVIDTDSLRRNNYEPTVENCVAFMTMLPKEEYWVIDAGFGDDNKYWPILTRATSKNREELKKVSIPPLNSNLDVDFKATILKGVIQGSPGWRAENTEIEPKE